MKHISCGVRLAVIAVVWCVSMAVPVRAVDRFWKADDGVFDGAWDKPSHWDGATVPVSAGDSAFIGGNSLGQSLTVTMPDGIYDSYSRLFVTAEPGCSITVDGSDSVFRHPTNVTGVAYKTLPFTVSYANTSRNVFQFSTANANTGSGTLPQFEFTNFLFKATSDAEERKIKVEFAKGLYNFVDPVGHNLANGIYPILYIFGDNNNGGVADASQLDSAEVEFGALSSLWAHTLALSGNAATNVLRFAGGRHVSTGTLYLPARLDGANVATCRTVTDVVAEGDASVDFNSVNLCNATQFSNRLVRIVAEGRSTISIGKIPSSGYGSTAFVADGGTVKFAGGNAAHNLNSANASNVFFRATNGGRIVFSQDAGQQALIGPAADVGRDVALGWFDCGTLEVTRSMYVYNGIFDFRNSVVNSTGTITLGKNSRPVVWNVGEGSVVTNLGTFKVASAGAAVLSLSNATMITSNPLVVGDQAGSSGALLLDGATIVSPKTYKNAGSAELRANGGTIRAPSDAPEFLEGFDTASVGAAGLVIDNGGNAITVRQDFSNLGDTRGMLVFAGTGVTTVKNDMSGVSRVAIESGTVDLSQLTEDSFQSLSLADGVTIVVDPSKALSASSLELGVVRLSFAEGVSIGDEFTVFNAATELDASSIANWSRAYVVAGLPDGASCDFSHVAAIGGGYELKVAVREKRTIQVSLASGEETKTADYSFGQQDVLEVTAGEGASLSMTGALGNGRLVKLGAGTLYLSNAANEFVAGFSLEEGRISVDSGGALGVANGNCLANPEIKSGVLEFTQPSELSCPISLVPETTNDVIVIKNEAALKMPLPSGNGKGEFVKRGPGALTLTVDGIVEFTGGAGKGNRSGGFMGQSKNDCPQMSYDAAGWPTNSGIFPMTVAEGELRIVGQGEGAEVTMAGQVAVGVCDKEGTSEPGLVLDNVHLNNSTWPYSYTLVGVALHNNYPDDFAHSPYLVLTNGAKLTANTLQLARLDADSDGRLSLDCDASTIELTGGFWPNRAQGATVKSKANFSNGSSLYVPKIRTYHDAEMIFDGSVCAKNANLEPMEIATEVDTISDSTLDMHFRNGSTFYCNSIGLPTTASITHPLTLTFDNSGWIPSSGDFVFDWGEKSSWMSIVSTNVGLTLNVPAEKIWTMNQPVTGTGGIVKRGDGALVLKHGAIGYSGTTRIESGTVDLDGQVAALSLSGCGTLENGTLVNGVIEVSLRDDGTIECGPISFSNVSFGGRVTVDCGRRDAESELTRPYRPVVVATYDGDAPDVSNWRAVNVGRAQQSYLLGEFAAADGAIYLTPILRRGTCIIVR